MHVKKTKQLLNPLSPACHAAQHVSYTRQVPSGKHLFNTPEGTRQLNSLFQGGTAGLEHRPEDRQSWRQMERSSDDQSSTHPPT